MLTPELYEQVGRESKRLSQVVSEWVECPVCKSETGARIEFVEDSDAFLEVYCKDCGVTADRGTTNPPVTLRMPPTTVGVVEERLQGRLDAEQGLRESLHDKLQQKTPTRRRSNLQGEPLRRRILYYLWVARLSITRPFRQQ